MKICDKSKLLITHVSDNVSRKNIFILDIIFVIKTQIHNEYIYIFSFIQGIKKCIFAAHKNIFQKLQRNIYIY